MKHGSHKAGGMKYGKKTGLIHGPGNQLLMGRRGRKMKGGKSHSSHRSMKY